MGKKILTDQEMNAYEGSVKKKLSDEEMQQLEASQNFSLPPNYQAGLESFGNAATMGYLPHIQAGSQPIFDALGDLLNGTNVSGEDYDYIKERDQNIDRQNSLSKQYPEESLYGTILGTAASAIPMTNVISKIKPIGNLMKGKTLPQRVAGAAAAGAVQGAAHNPGDIKGELSPLQLPERATNALVSGAIAAPLHYGAEKFLPKAKQGAKYLKGKAEELAFRGLGPFQRQADQNSHRINQIGRTALDEGVIVFPPTSAAGVADRAGEALVRSGQNLDKIIDELLLLEKQTKGRFSSGSKKRLTDYLKAKLLVKSDVPGIQENNRFFSQMIDDLYDSMGRMNFEKIRKMKIEVGGASDKNGRRIGGLINWDRLKSADIPIKEQFYRVLYDALKTSEEAGADALEQAWHGANSTRFLDAKSNYGDLKAAQKIATKRSSAQKANQIMGLKSAVFGAGGASAGAYIGHKIGGEHFGTEGAILGGALGTGGGAIANYLAKNYGAQFSSVLLDQASKILEATPNLLQTFKQYPNLLPHFIDSLKGNQEIEDPSFNERSIKKGMGEPYSKGGKVLGRAKLPGNSSKNDTVKALLSPGEIVIPRTSAGSPGKAKSFIDHMNFDGSGKSKKSSARIRALSEGGIVEPSRDLASIEVMNRSFPNYYKKYNYDPAMVSPKEHYNSIMAKDYVPGLGSISTHGPGHELVKDLFGDKTATPSIVDPQILKKSGFSEKDIPIVYGSPEDQSELNQEGSNGYYSPNEGRIVLNQRTPNLERAATLMHELQHAKDFKEGGYRGVPQSRLKINDVNNADNEILSRSEEILGSAYKGHHKHFKHYNMDISQYEIAKENILQGDPVHPEVLARYPDLQQLQNEYKNNPKAFAGRQRIYVDNTPPPPPTPSPTPAPETYEEASRRRLKENELKWEQSKEPFERLLMDYVDKKRTDSSQFYEPEYTRMSKGGKVPNIKARLKSLGKK